MKRIVFISISVLITLWFLQTASYALTDPPEITAESAILIDAVTGDILYEKDKDAYKEPASTTKMITCLLALENLPLDKVVTVDSEAPFTDGSRIYLVEGEEITVEQLLYALMLESANDTAVALAKEISGSVEAFADLMNSRARELGAIKPSFKNPNGLHLEGHYATAYDLAMIAKGAMQNPEFRKIVSTVSYTIPATNKQPERGYIYTTNRLLYDAATKVPVRGIMTPAKYEGAIGIKTGYTSQAGGCLVAGAERDGTELIAVVLKSTDLGRFGDAIALLDFGFENYYTYKAVDKNTKVEDVKVSRGSVNYVPAKIEEDRYITLPTEASPSLVTTETVMDGNVTAPVSAGQKLGKIEIYEGGDIIGEVAVLAEQDIPGGMFLSRFGVEDSVSKAIYRYAATFAGAIVLLIVLYTALRVRYKLRRRAMRAKRAMEIAREREKKQLNREQRRWPY